METFTFVVEGSPVPQGSKRAFVVKGRAVIADVKSDRLKKWRRAVSAAAAAAATGDPIDTAVEVRIDFDLERPVSAAKRRYPFVAPDIDKLARAVLDGLTDSRLISDDSRVVRLVAEKFYGPTPGARVTVAVLSGEDAAA